MDAMKIANSAPMWIAAGIAVAIVVVQALVFAVKSYKAGKEMGITEKQMKNAMKSSAITSIGPSIVILSSMLALLITVGAPVAWMRLSMIGSVMFESLAAGIGTNTIGVELGVDEMTPLALSMAVWTMVLCSIGWVIFATISASRMEKVQNKLSGGDPKKLISISTAAVIGVFCAMSAQHLIKALFGISEEGATILQFNPNKNAIACILGGVIMFIMVNVSNKVQIKGLKEWNLAIAIFGSMIITALLPF